MSNEISNSDDVIDSRDVISRIEELENELGYWLEEEDGSSEDEWEDFDELESLRNLQGQAEGYSEDWTYGAQLVNESYFVEHVKEMLVDCGSIPNNVPDYVVINWDETADNIKVDYTEVDFDGVAYFLR